VRQSSSKEENPREAKHTSTSSSGVFDSLASSPPPSSEPYRQIDRAFIILIIDCGGRRVKTSSGWILQLFHRVIASFIRAGCAFFPELAQGIKCRVKCSLPHSRKPPPPPSYLRIISPGLFQSLINSGQPISLLEIQAK
jgi:hypothetical protein